MITEDDLIVEVKEGPGWFSGPIITVQLKPRWQGVARSKKAEDVERTKADLINRALRVLNKKLVTD